MFAVLKCVILAFLCLAAAIEAYLTADNQANTEGLLVLFTGLLVIVGFLQWWLIRRQDGHFRNSERAWILAELGWYEGGVLHIAISTSQENGVIRNSTVVNVKLTCRNEGRSPAWIENTRGRIEIVAKLPANEAPQEASLADLGPMQSLGAGKERSRVLEFICPAHTKEGEFFSIYVVVEYRDIFGIKRETTLGYSVDPNGRGMYRQDSLSERNRNT